MKKLIILALVGILISIPAYSKTDKTSVEYLKNRKHFSIMNPTAERIAQKIIKKLLKNESGNNFNVKLKGYTLSSMKQGIFKHLEIEGKDFFVEGIPVPYAKIKTLTDYNWIDYKEDPPICRTNMEFEYFVNLSEESINTALQKEEYTKKLNTLNEIAYPLFIAKEVKVKLKENRLYIIMKYNFPISPMQNDKHFIMASDFKVENNNIIAKNIKLNKAYGAMQLDKIANLINKLDPLTFTLSLMNTKKCNAKIENVKINDDLVEINGKIFVEGD